MNIYYVNRYSKYKGPFDIIDSNRQHIIKVGDICLRDYIEGIAFLVVCSPENSWNACKSVGIGDNDALSEQRNTLLFSFDGLSKRKGDVALIKRLTLCFREKVIDDFFRNAVEILEYKKDFWDGSLFPKFFASSQETVDRDEQEESYVNTETNYYPSIFAKYLSKELLELLKNCLDEGKELKEAYMILREKHPVHFRDALMKFLAENPTGTIYDKPADVYVPPMTETEVVVPKVTLQNDKPLETDDNIDDEPDDEPLKANERIGNYLLEIGRQELLSDEEEIELAQKVRKGDINARNKLVSANMRFVAGFVKQYLHKGLEFEDLLHEGFKGLIRAAQRFDETRGFGFIHYASWWIRRYLSNAIVNNSSLIRFPLNVQILHRRIWDFKNKYEQQNGFLPPITAIEVDDEDNLEKISFLDSLPNNLKNTSIPCEDLDIFEDNHNDIEDYDDNEYNTHNVRSLLDRLSKRERDILIRVYGIGVKEETLEIIGESYGLTRERVRQIKEKAIRKLREFITMHKAADDEEEGISEQEEAKSFVESKPKTKRERKESKEKFVPRFLPNPLVRREQPVTQDFTKEESNIQYEVGEKNGLKVGDNIYYDNRYCAVRKIIESVSSSKLIVEYSNGVRDFVPFDKSRIKRVVASKEANFSSNHEGNKESQLLSYSTSLHELVRLKIITRKQLKHCRKRNLRTIGDVQQIIEKYHLTPDSPRFTQYTLDMWFSIVGLVNPKAATMSVAKSLESDEQGKNSIALTKEDDGIEHVYVDIPSAAPYTETEVSDTDTWDEEEQTIDTTKLKIIFDNKSTSYKYFWFMAIISLVKENHSLSITYDDLVIRMATLAWPVVFEHEIVFGNQDKIYYYLDRVVNKTSLSNIRESSNKIIESHLHKYYKAKNIDITLSPLLKNVPYRFLSPWIKYSTDEEVCNKSREKNFKGMYALYPDRILINKEWWAYIESHFDEVCNFTMHSFFSYTAKYNSPVKMERFIKIGWHFMKSR